METWFTLMVTLLTLIASGAVGAFFAAAKFRRERLWSERYQRLGDALARVNLMGRHFESEVTGDAGMHGLTSTEKKELAERWPTARHELTREIMMLQMLFTKRDYARVWEAWFNLHGSIWDLLEMSSSHDAHSYFAKAAHCAWGLEEALVALSRRKCLGFGEKVVDKIF